MARILIADDEPGLREFMADALAHDGHDVTQASDGHEAKRKLEKRAFDLMFTDLNMPGMDGMTLLRKVRTDQPEVQVVVITAHGTIDTAVEAIKLGAFDYLEKPVDGPDELCLIASRALERRRLVNAEARAQQARPGGVTLSYGDPAMTAVIKAIDKVAPTAATVLLLGESGSGKEVAARSIHEQSERRQGPFMAVNCAALSETLLESELFGHEKGAFTSADTRHRGRIELADKGTFFLDEVGELKPAMQAKLLRVIQERRFERVGGTQTIEVDVRWVAATNRDLGQMITDGSFREDLYHRLAVFPIRLPPLRERVSDIAPLARSLLVSVAAELKRPGLTLSEAAETRLTTWTWPGNVRELRNVLERAAILADGNSIAESDVWLEPAGNRSSVSPALELASLADLERAAIERTLLAVGGNRRRAAEILGIGERTLYDKLKRYEIA